MTVISGPISFNFENLISTPSENFRRNSVGAGATVLFSAGDDVTSRACASAEDASHNDNNAATAALRKLQVL